MPLQIIADNERLECRISDLTFYYRRIRLKLMNQYQRERTKPDGSIDHNAFAQDILTYCLVGWQGVENGGVPLDFKSDLIDSLPGNVQAQLVKAITEASMGQEYELKNS